MLMLLVLSVLAPCLFFLYLEVKYFKHKQIVNRLPGPATLPLVGNAHQMGKTPGEILNNLFLLWNKFGKDNYRIWIGYNANIVISNVKDMEYVLTSTTLTKKSFIYNMLHPWLGLGLLTSSGAKWFKHRKMITPSFHFKILQDFHEIMNENSMKFIEKLRTEAAGETIFDFQEMVHYLTLDIICETAMGVPINAMDNNDSEVVKAFKDMCYNINMRAFDPIKSNQMLYRFSPDYPEYKRTLKILQDFTNDVIEKRLQALRERAKNPEISPKTDDEFTRRKQAFLDTLLSANIDGRPLTQQEIYEEVSTFMFEGHDTTTSGISFGIYMLSRHPALQQKVYEEQLEIFGNTNLQRDATFTEIGEMKYLDLVIKEAQRLYPSVPSIGREADRDYDMNGTHISKGSSLNLFIMAMGYNEKTFEDPYLCRPERFDNEQRTTKPNPFENVPFSAGPRNCIGQKFALLELKTVISKVVRCFEILPPLDELVSRDGYVQHFLGLSPEEQLKKPQAHKLDPQLSAVLTLKSENGILLRLRARK